MQNEAQSYIYLLGPDGYQAAYQFIVQESKIAKYVFAASEDLAIAGYIFGIQILQHTKLHEFLTQALGLPLTEQRIIAAGLACIMQENRIVVYKESKHVKSSPNGAKHAQRLLNSWRS